MPMPLNDVSEKKNFSVTLCCTRTDALLKCILNRKHYRALSMQRCLRKVLQERQFQNNHKLLQSAFSESSTMYCVCAMQRNNNGSSRTARNCYKALFHNMSLYNKSLALALINLCQYSELICKNSISFVQQSFHLHLNKAVVNFYHHSNSGLM